MKEKILGGLMIIGFLIIVGTAGASDYGNIDFSRIVIQGMIGLILLIIGYLGLRRLDYEISD